VPQKLCPYIVTYTHHNGIQTGLPLTEVLNTSSDENHYLQPTEFGIFITGVDFRKFFQVIKINNLPTFPVRKLNLNILLILPRDAVLARYAMALRPSVRLSLTSRSWIKTAKHVIRRTTS